VLNKIDLLSPDEAQNRTETLKGVTAKPIPISALYKTNTQLLKQEMLLRLGECVQASFSLPVTDETMAFLSWLYKHSDVHNVKYEGDSMNVVFESIPWFAEKVRGKVEKLGGVFSS
jgi:GTP-binding protein HflX